jgi:hypothetical protein
VIHDLNTARLAQAARHRGDDCEVETVA